MTSLRKRFVFRWLQMSLLLPLGVKHFPLVTFVQANGDRSVSFRERLPSVPLVHLRSGRRQSPEDFTLRNAPAIVVVSEGCAACEKWLATLNRCRPRHLSVIAVGNGRYAQEKLRGLSWAEHVYWLKPADQSKLSLRATPFNSVRQNESDGTVKVIETIGQRTCPELMTTG